MLTKKPHLGIVSLSKHADTDAGVIDEGPYTYEHIVAEDVIWTPPAGRLDHGEFDYGRKALRERADAFLIHFGLSGDPLDTYLLSLSRALEEAGHPVLNSFEFTWTCGDKHFALERARGLGIPTPKTLLAKPTGKNVPDLVSTVEDKLSYPLVVKPRGTMKGFGVIKVTDRDLLVSTLQLYSASGMSCLVQEFIESGGREVRCFYAGGELLGIYDRRRDHSKFIGVATPRVGQGSDVTVSCLDTDLPEARELMSSCEKLLAGFTWDLAAIDWFGSEHGLVLNEINTVPGIYSIPEADRVIFHERVADAIQRRSSPSAHAPGR
ncbi:RimK family alpha-L-glutamate ligase [Streptomyces sp. SID12501]|uniref:ATP-grasp domain-containing protein n=1 Tax=Streptomyces sp. SID12501 TaxID=2706042 RepID=A0A6B3BTV2_9ACTN|nr:hypothetical protein [Streptomyces sp. SID12501]NEC87732.1 hypothetical protein [Streptomyces sp. SID12501]